MLIHMHSIINDDIAGLVPKVYNRHSMRSGESTSIQTTEWTIVPTTNIFLPHPLTGLDAMRLSMLVNLIRPQQSSPCGVSIINCKPTNRSTPLPRCPHLFRVQLHTTTDIPRLCPRSPLRTADNGLNPHLLSQTLLNIHEYMWYPPL